jgi:hypothetical protein
MHKLKYVRFETRLADSVFLFPTWETHSEVALRLGYKPVSAGFVSIWVHTDNQIRVQTHGRSESLNMESDPQDAQLIHAMLKNS